MKAIILSAGQGTRLLPLTARLPKCLLDLDEGTTLLGWQLSQLAAAGIEKAVVVTGYKADAVEAEAARYRDRIDTRALRNPDFGRMDNLGSAWMARGEMDEDFILLNGDTLFTAAVARQLCSAAAPVTVAISKKTFYDEDDMKVSLDNGRVRAVAKTLLAAETHAESIGMILFRGEGVDWFRQSAVEVMEKERREARGKYYLWLIDRLARSMEVGYMEMPQEEWAEIDFPDDLAAARKAVGRWRRQSAEPSRRAL